MRRPFFRHLDLEQLEDRTLTNMPFGQLGTPVLGLSSVNLDNARLDVSSLVAFNSITKSAGDGQANNGLLTHASGGHGNSTAISGTGHHCCSHVEIEASALPGSGKIPNGDAVQETASASGEFRSLGDVANLAAGFDSLVDYSFDSAFPSAKNASPVLAGGGDGGMSLHAGVSDNAASGGIGSASGSSSGTGGLSGGFLASPSGSVALATASPSGPMILLPSGHSASAVVSGSQKVSPGSPSISPAFASGPLHPDCFDPVCLMAQAYVPVNADDDNGSAVTNGIPATRDFSKNPLTNNDPELLSATLTADTSLPPPPNGSWTVSITPLSAPGKIALWIDQKKTANFSPSGLGTMPFYIEGVHESATLNELTLTFTYNYTDINNVKQTASASATITVTPLINGFTITPAGPLGTQNINFINGVDATGGIIAGIPATNTNGATFDGSVRDTGLTTGNLVFIQNVRNITNGYHGTTLNGNPIGYLYSAGSNPAGVNIVLANNNKLPILDGDPNNIPEYPFNTLQNDGNTYQIQGVDSPRTGINYANSNLPPPGPQAGVVFDAYFKFSLWLLWKYWARTVGPAGNQINVPAVYYPLAVADWSVEWFANAQNANGTFNPNGPVNHILIPQGISASTYSRTNSPPPSMQGPVVNNVIAWAAP